MYNLTRKLSLHLLLIGLLISFNLLHLTVLSTCPRICPAYLSCF